MDAVTVKPCDISIISGQKCMEYRRNKTDVTATIPLLGPLTGILQPSPSNAPFCSALCNQSASALSNRFAWIMDKAGIDTKETILPNGRKQRSITFHSLRHRFVTWLSEIGVPKDIRKMLAGHTSDSAHDTYDHATVANVMPRLFSAIAQQSPRPEL